MGTNNFHKKNASSYYAVLMDYEEHKVSCPICGETHFGDKEGEEITCCNNLLKVTSEKVQCEDYHREDLLNYLRERIDHHFKGIYASDEEYKLGNDLDYRKLFSVQTSRNFMESELIVEVTAVLRHGYYEGANLDWEYKFWIGGTEYDLVGLSETRYVAYDLAYSMEHPNEGLAKSNCSHAVKWLTNELTRLSELMEKAYAEVSTHKLVCVAVASNGEAFYQKVD